MLLAVNVGNTNTAFGVYDGERLAADRRVRTEADRSPGDYAALVGSLALEGAVRLSEITDFALCSVVPQANDSLFRLAREYLRIEEPFTLTAAADVGIRINYDPPADLGADRVANAVAAHALYGGPVIVVDLGTATTFDAVSADGDYQGGAIAPGVGASADALLAHTAQLRKVPLDAPPKAIGRTTEACLRSGIVYGFAAQVDGMVERFRQEMGAEACVVATGGLAEVIAPHSRTIQQVAPHLTLEGVRIAYSRAARKD